MGDGAEDNATHSQTQRLAQVTWALQGNARVTDVFHRTSMRIIRKCDTTKHWILFQEDEVQYEDMMPIVNPGQSCNDFSAIWRFVPRTCDGNSYTISHLYRQRIYAASRCSRFATSAICLFSAELTEVEKRSQAIWNRGSVLEFAWKYGLATVLLQLGPSEPKRVGGIPHA